MKTTNLYFDEIAQAFLVSDIELKMEVAATSPDCDIYFIVTAERADIERFCATALDKYKQQQYPATFDAIQDDFFVFMNPNNPPCYYSKKNSMELMDDLVLPF